MRVAHLTTVDLSLRYLVLPQLQAVVASGGEAIGISAPGPFVDELEQAGIRHVALTSSTRGMDLRADLRAAVELWRILRRERVDVLHTHNPKPGVYGRIVGRLAGVPVVVNTVHGLYATPDDRPAKRAVVYTLEAIAARCSHAELVQSHEDLALLRRLRITPRRKARLLGNGIDLDRFRRDRFDGAERAAARRELGIADNQVAVLAVGRLVAEKGYRELFEAVAKLGERYVLVVAGGDEPDKPDALAPDEIAAARAAGVRFLGWARDVDRLYAAADVFAFPSHREGFPRSPMEAAAMGLPVVAADIRGSREVVVDGVNGFLVPVRDAEALAGGLRRLGDDPELRRTMGDAGVRLAHERFDEALVVRTVLDTYAEVRRRKGLEPAEAAVRRRRRPVARALKRLVDVVAAGAALVLLSPVLGVVAVLVRLRLGSPVLFVQQRPGLGGAPFEIRKFRTMTDGRDAAGRLLPDEQRMTALGRFLRSTSLDELPELWNVLRGDMSLVGPRPLLVEYLDRYSPRQARRHEVRPGLTGWAQVNGRNATTWDDRLEMDVWYVDHWSIPLDLRILARTVGHVVRREGISQAGHATMPKFGEAEVPEFGEAEVPEFGEAEGDG